MNQISILCFFGPTLLETNISPPQGIFEDDFPFSPEFLGGYTKPAHRLVAGTCSASHQGLGQGGSCQEGGHPQWRCAPGFCMQFLGI